MWVWTLDQEDPLEKHGNPLQNSCLKNLMDREAWWDTIHRVAKSERQLKQLSTHVCKILKLPTNKSLGQRAFSDDYQHREELTSILLKLSWKTKEEVMLSSQYYTASNFHTKTHKWKLKSLGHSLLPNLSSILHHHPISKPLSWMFLTLKIIFSK